MAERKTLSASLRWSVFARDGFACRYCGAMAGQDGVELAIDHVISVAEGGDNSIGNLATSCKRCNGGKSARSLDGAPPTARTDKANKKRAAMLLEQAEAVRMALEAESAFKQQIVNLVCHGYGTQTVYGISDQNWRN